MDTMNIALPESLKDFVVTRVSEGGYSSVSEYIRELIRSDQKQKAWAILEAEALKGIESGPSVPMTKEDWTDIRNEVRRRHEARKTQEK